MPTPLWLDCDTGHDDAFAILLAARHPYVELLGISTVYGNAPLARTTYNTRAILKAVEREDVPVYAGARKPFCREVVHAADIHGESGLDGTTLLPVPDTDVRTDKTCIDAMCEALISTTKGTAQLVLTGALTNGALLFASHPDLIDHIRGLSIMGGAIGDGFTEAEIGGVNNTYEPERIGNVTSWAEFNVYSDPESAKSLLSQPTLAAKTTLITLDLSHTFLASQDVRDSMLHGWTLQASETRESSTVRRLFVEILQYFAKTYWEVFSIPYGPPVHDPLAVAAAFRPQIFLDDPDGETKRYTVEVITDGAHTSSVPVPADAEKTSQCGRTIATLVSDSLGGGVRIPKDVDTTEMWIMLDKCLGLIDKAAPKSAYESYYTSHEETVRGMPYQPEFESQSKRRRPAKKPRRST